MTAQLDAQLDLRSCSFLHNFYNFASHNHQEQSLSQYYKSECCCVKRNMEKAVVNIVPTHGDGNQNQPKNYVIDYGNFRRKGYFLDKSAWHEKEMRNNADLKSAESSSNSYVLKWLSSLPEGAEYLKDPDGEDMMGEAENGDSAPNDVYRRYMSDEAEFKLLILERDRTLKYTSLPREVLNQKQLKLILELGNTKIDEYLGKIRKLPRHFEYEYVSGTVALPASWNRESLPSDDLQNVHALFSWIKNMIHFWKNPHDTEPDFKDTAEGPVPEMCGVILEPYHGPVFLNGATIEAGSTNIASNSRRGVFATAVEEIKKALQAIRRTLRHGIMGLDYSQPAAQLPTTPSLSDVEGNHLEDTEIQRLTEMLRNIQSSSKRSTLRSVFGFRKRANPQNNTLDYLDNHQRQRTGFFRALEGWLQRKIHRSNRRQPYQTFRDIALSAAGFRNGSIDPRVGHNQNPPRNHNNSSLENSGNLVQPTVAMLIRSNEPTTEHVGVLQNVATTYPRRAHRSSLQSPDQRRHPIRRIGSRARIAHRRYHMAPTRSGHHTTFWRLN